jgi:hypothetical protein
MGIMDIYEVELCRRGRWQQQDPRFIAAGDADEAAYKVSREHLHSEGESRKVRVRVRKLGNGSQCGPPSARRRGGPLGCGSCTRDDPDQTRDSNTATAPPSPPPAVQQQTSAHRAEHDRRRGS